MKKTTADSVNAIIRTIINISVNILFLAVMAILIYSYAGKAYEFGRSIFDEKPIDTQTTAKVVVVTIPKSASNSDVAGIVAKEGLVESKYAFLIQLVLSDHKDDIIPGTYTLNTGMTPTEMIEMLSTKVEEKGETTNDN
ncbi:MAG: endolytic transglycosylase MltG [Lachnospiraceae bacterium]